MPHLVYKMIFNKRKKKNIKPYLYIGSKSNCTYKNGLILDSRGNPYYGSSSYENFFEILKKDEITVEILKTFTNYTDALNYESAVQKSLDVVANDKYFNKAIANVNNYTDPNFATYKHSISGKTVRLPRDHPMVLSNEYVGVSKGEKLTLEQRKKIGRKGKDNPFYGKQHTEETKKKIIQRREKFYQNNPGLKEKHSKEQSERAKKNFSGIPKTPEHRKKIGRKGLIMLKNKDTGETVRIIKEDRSKYDPNIWMNPYILSENKTIGSKWITDGKNNRKIKKNEMVPEGWKFGRTYNGWNDKKGKNK